MSTISELDPMQSLRTRLRPYTIEEQKTVDRFLQLLNVAREVFLRESEYYYTAPSSVDGESYGYYGYRDNKTRIYKEDDNLCAETEGRPRCRKLLVETPYPAYPRPNDGDGVLNCVQGKETIIQLMSEDGMYFNITLILNPNMGHCVIQSLNVKAYKDRTILDYRDRVWGDEIPDKDIYKSILTDENEFPDMENTLTKEELQHVIVGDIVDPSVLIQLAEPTACKNFISTINRTR